MTHHAQEMALKAGFSPYEVGTDGVMSATQRRHVMRIEHLIALAKAEEREACAKVCDDYENRLEGMRDEDYQAELAGRQMGAHRCAKAIRARGQA